MARPCRIPDAILEHAASWGDRFPMQQILLMVNEVVNRILPGGTTPAPAKPKLQAAIAFATCAN
jgi:hypothetical protein